MNQENIIIENHFDFVDICEKNIKNYEQIIKIKNIINLLNESINKENNNNIKTILKLKKKLFLVDKILKKIEENLIK
jgi:hypothetical protein